MTRRTTLARRLTGVVAGSVLVGLLLTGFGMLVLVRADAQHATATELRRDLVGAAVLLGSLDGRGGPLTELDPAVRSALVRSFRLQDAARLQLLPDGRVVGDLPPEISATDLTDDALRFGAAISGGDRDVVWAAAPIRPAIARRRPGQPLAVVAATREVSSTVGGAGRWFVVSAVAAAAAATVVGRRAAARVADPLERAADATRRIAMGDLDARVATDDVADRELAELGESVNAMATQLQRQRTAERSFLMSVSHDLRTPLTSIRGYAEAITDGAAEPSEAAAVIEAESARLERLVGDLLALARLDADRFDLDLEPVDLGDAVAAAVEAFEPAAAEAGVALSSETPEGLTVLADPDRLAQVMANLIENGLRHATSAIAVSVAPAADGAGAVVHVDDDGPGIPDEERARVFDRLYTSARPHARATGTGLGLTIARELATAMGGTLEAAASPAGGARFVLWLPTRSAGGQQP